MYTDPIHFRNISPTEIGAVPHPTASSKSSWGEPCDLRVGIQQRNATR